MKSINDKNSLWAELNIQKTELNVKAEIPLTITDSNQALLPKMSTRGLQEEIFLGKRL
jgi:hypothetical protein